MNILKRLLVKLLGTQNKSYDWTTESLEKTTVVLKACNGSLSFVPDAVEVKWEARYDPNINAVEYPTMTVTIDVPGGHIAKNQEEEDNA